MFTRALSIGAEMVPSGDLWIKSAIRVGVGLAVLPWFEFGGKFMFMLAAIGLVGHAEGIFAKHAAAKIKTEAERLYLLVLMFVFGGVRGDDEDKGGMS